MEKTFILTAEIDAENFAWLDRLRREHFPPERNFLSAHLTLFHKLSQAQIDSLKLLELPKAPIRIDIDQVIFLGFGVALHVQSERLEHLRNDICKTMGGELSQQDRQRWKPHVTIQNKVTAERARTLLQELSDGFLKRPGTVTGLLVWQYLGGPWQLASRAGFGA